MQDQAGKATVRDFAVDATLDVNKGLVAGAFGVWSGAAIGAAAGSVVPVIGTAVGFVAGLGLGYYASVKIEQAYDANGSRNYFKNR